MNETSPWPSVVSQLSLGVASMEPVLSMGKVLLLGGEGTGAKRPLPLSLAGV